VQVASIQTLMRREIPHADVVVVDEAHQWFKFMGEWMARWDAIPFVGLSATPWTKGLGKHYDDLIIGATTQDLIDAGHLSKFRVFAPSKPDLSGVRTVAGDWHEGDLGRVMNQAPLVADIVRTWLQRAADRPTLVFAVDRAHARSLQRDFESAGVTTGYIDANTERKDRNVLAEKFRKGEIRVICNVGCLTTGVDWDVRCIVLARPTKSEILFTQIIGRGLRTAEGKDDCLILDHSDTHERLGFVTDIHHETLCDGKPKERSQSERAEPLPKACAKCSFVKPPKTPICPACGFKPEARSEVEVIDGNLEEMRQKKLNRKESAVEKAQFYGELRWYAKQNGYSEGWASHKYRERFGVWPNAHRNAEMHEPSSQTIGFIKSRQIAYAKRNEQSALHRLIQGKSAEAAR
jgi:superfamily II DNA or RNA helicase